jgi:hypothetical protein
VGCGETGTPGVYADVSKATCWIDYVMAGNVPVRAQEGSTVNTFWGYSQDVCGTWLDYKLDGPLPDVVKSLYQKWNVNWLITKSEPQVSSGDGSYNEPLTDGDADTYNEDTRDVEPYNDANQNAEPYSDGTKAVEPYSDDTKDAEPYSGGIKDAEPYSDGTKDAEPYSDGTKDAEPYSDGTKEAEPYSDGTKDAEPYSDDTKDAQPYTDETKEPDSYSEDQVVDVAKTADPYRR